MATWYVSTTPAKAYVPSETATGRRVAMSSVGGEAMSARSTLLYEDRLGTSRSAGKSGEGSRTIRHCEPSRACRGTAAVAPHGTTPALLARTPGRRGGRCPGTQGGGVQPVSPSRSISKGVAVCPLGRPPLAPLHRFGAPKGVEGEGA